MKRIGIVLAIAVLAGSILSGCAIEPAGGRYGDRGRFGDRSYYGDRGYYYGHPGPYYNRDR
jgi:hypothetical protein